MQTCITRIEQTNVQTRIICKIQFRSSFNLVVSKELRNTCVVIDIHA